MGNIPKTLIGLLVPPIAAIGYGAIVGFNGAFGDCGATFKGLDGALVGIMVFGFYFGLPGMLLGTLVGVILDLLTSRNASISSQEKSIPVADETVV